VAEQLQLTLTSQPEVSEMAENLSNSIFGNSGANFESAAKQGKAAFRQGIDAARKGVDAARESMGNPQEYVDRGVNLAGELTETLSDFISRQPLLAVAGAFLIGYMAARMLRKVSS
jgi:hypothetical protein